MNCYDCINLIPIPDGAGGGIYKCKNSRGLVLGEWGHWMERIDPEPVQDCDRRGE